MDRLALVASLLAVAACREDGGAATTVVTGVTSNVTTLTTGASSTTGEDDSGTGDSGGATSSGSTTGAVDGSSTTGDDATTTTGDTTGDASTTTGTTGPPDPIAECLEMVDPGDECTACICTDCLALWEACHADEGCAKIQQCAQDSSCYSLDCVGPCETIINWQPYGIDGPSFKLWKPLSDCLKATCRDLCPW